jgi:hypothetical protein
VAVKTYTHSAVRGILKNIIKVRNVVKQFNILLESILLGVSGCVLNEGATVIGTE